MEELLDDILKEFVDGLREVLSELKAEFHPEPESAPEQEPETEKPTFDLKIFFDEVRGSLFYGKLTKYQVSGMEAKLNTFRQRGFPLSWAAYALATSYHETARTMMPVREGLLVSDNYRKNHFRYYPWYGRGDVQLTWERNYKRADDELHLDGKLLENPDLALDPVISANVMAEGMTEGWFAQGHSLGIHLKNNEGTPEEFRECRKIINGTDRAEMVAGYAVKFQDALKKAGY